MGICISTRSAKGRGKLIKESTAIIIHEDGKLEELKELKKVRDLISENPNCFLCSSDSIYLDSPIPSLPDEEELQFNQIYFLLPLSKQHQPVFLPDLCNLAIKASNALHQRDMLMQEASPFLLVGSTKKHKSLASSEHCWNGIQVKPCSPETEEQWEGLSF